MIGASGAGKTTLAAGAGAGVAAGGRPPAGRRPGPLAAAARVPCSDCAGGCSWRRRCRRCRRASVSSPRCWPAGCRRWACWPACARCSIRATSRRRTRRWTASTLADKLFERVDRLSGGERQRVGLARALLVAGAAVAGRRALVGAGPDPLAPVARTLVDDARERGVTLVATLHQVDMALAAFPAHRRPARGPAACSICRPHQVTRARLAAAVCAARGRARRPHARRAPSDRARWTPSSRRRCTAAESDARRRHLAALPRCATRPGSAACSGSVRPGRAVAAGRGDRIQALAAVRCAQPGRDRPLPRRASCRRRTGPDSSPGGARDLAHRGHRHRRHDAWRCCWRAGDAAVHAGAVGVGPVRPHGARPVLAAPGGALAR